MPSIRIWAYLEECTKGFSPPGMPSVTSTEQARVETAVNYELGYRFNKYGLNAQIAGFLNNYDNILGSDNVSSGGAGTGNMFNAGKAKIQGIELSMNMICWQAAVQQAGLRLPLGIAYTYTSAKFQETFKMAEATGAAE